MVVALCLWCGQLCLSAQEFTRVDWEVLAIDSVPPRYEEVIPLGDEYTRYNYSVTLDYPEYTRLSAAEQRQAMAWQVDLPAEPQVAAGVAVSRRQGFLDVSFIPVVRREGGYYRLTSFKMTIHRTPVPQKRTTAAATSSRYAAASVLAQGRWVRIGITDDGVYRLTPDVLRGMGFADPSRVKLYGYGGHLQNEVIDADADFDDLEEVPLYRDSRGLLFYGQGTRSWTAPTASGVLVHTTNNYARMASYFLTEGDAPMAIATGNAGVSATATLTTTPHAVLYEKEEYAWYQSGRRLYEAQNYANSNAHTYTLTAPDAAGGQGTLVVSFTASSSVSATTLDVTFNGTRLRSVSIDKLPSGYYAAVEGRGSYTLTNVGAGGTDNRVSLVSTAGIDARLGYIELSYMRNLVLSQPVLPMRWSSTTPATLVLDTQGRANVKVWRLGRRGEPMAEMAGSRTGHELRVAVDDPSRTYVAVDVDADYPAPVSLGEVPNQNLHALGAADMVILVPSSWKLYAEAERLAEAHRSHDGLRVVVASAQQVYNEFSSGTPDATAYRRFMKMLYDRAATEADMPRYLLLFGDGVWDNRMLSSAVRNLNPDDYLLCYESANSLSHTSSFVMEDYFGLLDDGEGGSLRTDKPDLGVGRFPVTTAAQAKVMVDKTIDYMQNRYAGAWKNEICILGDDGDNNQHIRMADRLATLIEENYPEMQVNRILWDAYKRESTTSNNGYPGVEADIDQQMEQGVLLMNYMGHGNPRALSNELVLDLSDMKGFRSPRLPLWFTAACDVAPFDMMEENLGETAVLSAAGAAVAFVGTTRTVYATQNDLMNRNFCRYVLGRDEATGRRNTIGDAMRLSKVNLLSTGGEGLDQSENKLHYVLLGDPALKLGRPDYKVVVDAINGSAVSAEAFADFKAGNIAQVSGHVADEHDNICSDFHGVLSLTAYDSKSKVTCLNNDRLSDSPYEYYTRDKKLYSGSDSIRNGRFDIRFPIPLDIKYTGETGRIVAYAIDEGKQREANGYDEHIIVGGTGEDLMGDHQGPAITMWLNREDLPSGGTVNPTPCFYAILEDESGINTAAVAVGHDLQLTVDGDPDRTYVLNSYYQNDLGSYRRGTLAYVLPALDDGHHTLAFTAWDMMNNCSTATLDFNVDRKQAPDLYSITCTENPAREQTTFILHYNRPGAVCNFSLEVFDFAGRKLWAHTEQGAAADGIYRVQWNLTTSAGMPLSTGVYLYRISLSTEGSRWTSQANKLLILRNK